MPVAKNTLSLWLRDVPLSEEHRVALEARAGSARQRAAATLRAATRARRERRVEEAAAQIGTITPAELFVAGVVAYWAEGAKSKPWNQRATVEFTDSDPEMIGVCLRVVVRRNGDLLERIQGWFQGIVSTAGASARDT